MIPAIWGKLPFEQHNTISAEGKLHEKGNFLAQLFQEDFEALDAIEDGRAPLEDCKSSIVALFRDPILAETFQGIDLAKLCTKFWSVAVAPPGFKSAAEIEDGHDSEEEKIGAARLGRRTGTSVRHDSQRRRGFSSIRGL